MTDTPPPDEKPDADAVFQRTLANLVNTPHKPHKPSGKEPLTILGDSKGKGRGQRKPPATPS